ncbi:MAG: biotin transporter BioY [Lactobacillaceae bacterium]|jgi:biotin transport system substrate-specific component|nr:biotin transporter BioY [Lactobacillaceae bacterium]
MNTKELIQIGMFSALLMILSPIAFPIGPIPITLQSLIVGLISTLSPTKKIAFFAILLYLLFGAVGLPVFAGGKAGLSVIFGITGGYLLTFLLFPFFINREFPLFTNMFAGFMNLIFGSAFMTFILGNSTLEMFKAGIFPFIIPTIIKVIIISVIYKTYVSINKIKNN